MDVLAFSTPNQRDWRWRIVDYRGDTVEESAAVFRTIAEAVAEGAVRMRNHADRDIGAPARSFGLVAWRHRR